MDEGCVTMDSVNYWLSKYEEIATGLGLDTGKDRAAARLLGELLGECASQPEYLADVIRDNDVVIFGPSVISDATYEGWVTIVAGSPNHVLRGRGMVPDLLVTDLDGDVDSQLDLNKRGAMAVIHAHGDNIASLERWVPRFGMPRIGTTQVEPLANVHNFGGFTDGDRAVVMAANLGASVIFLEGFDFDEPAPKDVNLVMKRRKLELARTIIEDVARHHHVEYVTPASR